MRRARNSGSVYHRRYRTASGKVRASRAWTIEWLGTGGQRAKEVLAVATREEAEQVLRDRLRDRDAGKVEAPSLLTLGDMLTMVERDYLVNGRRSGPRMKQAAAHLRDFFGKDEPAPAVTVDRITAYTAHRLEEEARPATVNRELAALRRAFRLADRAGKVEARPDFAMLRENNTRKGFVEREQLDAILAHLPAEARPPVLVAYLTGWRMFSEVLTRQWRHVDLKARWLRLEPGEGKTGQGRMFPLAGELLGLLEGLKKEADASDRICPWVFQRRGQPIAGFRKAWLAACLKVGLPGRLVHDLRRSAVRNMERAGVPRSAAMQLVGHKTDSVYRRYAIVDEAMLREAAEKIVRVSGVIEKPNQARPGARRKRAKR